MTMARTLRAHSCHRQTIGLVVPDRRMISAVQQSSAVARLIVARQMCSAARCDCRQSP